MIKKDFPGITKWEASHSFGTIYGNEELQVVEKVLENWAPTNAEKVREFERKFAEYVGTKYALAVSSCAAGLHLAAIAIGIKLGDEVIMPTVTFSATANNFVFQKAKIIFVDSSPKTFNIIPEKIVEKITEKTKAIVVVHMCGYPCDMDPIMEIARSHNLVVVEDAAHAPGAEYKGKKIGSIGDFGIFSFQQSKNMSTLGEGGMITTDNEKYVEIISAYRAHGAGKYPGLNYRMTDVQGAVGVVQLKKLDRHNKIRYDLAHYLTEKIKDLLGITVPSEEKGYKHAYHLYNILIDEEKTKITRDDFIQQMSQKGIKCIAQYSHLVHLLDAYRVLGHFEGECPVSEETSRKIITLPLNPRLTFEDMDYLAEKIKEVLEESGRVQ